MQRDAASSQAAWALLTEGVTSASVEAHRLRHMITRVLKMVEVSPAKEHIYEVAGDLIQAVPSRLEALENDLNRTSYALTVIGEDHLRDRLPMADRKVVDEATERSKPMFGPMLNRVAERFMQADLNPPLGWRGGPCLVIDRIENEVNNPKLREQLIDSVEFGESLSNPAAAQVYDLEAERMPEGTRFKRLIISPHAQYRMDLRQINVPAVRVAIKSFYKAYSDEKSRQSPIAKRWEQDFSRSEAIVWTDKKLRLTIVFAIYGTDLKLVTTYWEGESDPTPPGDGGCAI